MLVMSTFVFGIISGFIFQAYLLFLFCPSIFSGGICYGLYTGQGIGEAIGFGLILMVLYQIAYLIGAIADSLLRAE
ncbi:hypothetical protein MWN34_10115 [Ancylobacter sp. 6x-1]|uniref:Uncharacterized protein n=1 Tax=Ancylobacter crimeensis TaxID=2579147 RepID=A0ABT0DBZ2_9HYPH|nr:hypothetical protein [Ancylobacter crimeensis]MCK0197267.1 hypothetical protein [Ancylobacter crimeensis]